MENTTILVAAHKQFEPLGIKGYLPVQVGAAQAQKDLGYRRDDQGDNISLKNPQYCELTAQYWAWKNLDSAILGLVHYRRYFVRDMYGPDLKREIPDAGQIEQLLEQYKIVLPKPVYKLSRNGTLYHNRPREGQDKPLLLLEEILQERCPEYGPSFEKFVYGKRASFGNMLLAKREEFNAYSEWMFPLLEEFEKRGEQQGIMVPRLCGFLSEYLLCIWVDHNIPPQQVLYMDVCNTEENTRAVGYRLRRFLVRLGVFEPISTLAYRLYYLVSGR